MQYEGVFVVPKMNQDNCHIICINIDIDNNNNNMYY